MPIILLTTEGNEGCRVDKNLAHLHGVEGVVVAFREVADAGVHRNRINFLQ